jgi:hypothetical protein
LINATFGGHSWFSFSGGACDFERWLDKWPEGLPLVLGCSSMNARVFMVLVFSSIFMGIWNSDQKAMDSTIARNKRLNKPIAVFSMPSVETVQREKMSAVDFSVPEPRPVRIAMRASNDAGQNEPVIERQDRQTQQHSAAQGSVVNLTPVSEGAVSEDGGNAIEANAVDEAVKVLSVNTLVSEPTASEIVATESELVADAESSVEESKTEESKTEESVSSTESSVSNESVQVELQQGLVEESAPGQEEVFENVSEEVVAVMPAADSTVTEPTVSATAVDEIESSSVPAPEDFSVEKTADSGSVEAVTESVPTEDVATEQTAVEAVETEAVVAAEVAAMVAENSTEETVVDQSGDDAVQVEQSVTGATEAELPEPADPIATESVTSETNEDEKSLEDRLLQSGEYDMLDVHAEDVTPGNVEPAVDGGATCIPLPRNLASGTWQVIHSSGEFFRITVDRGANSTGKYSDGDDDVLETSFCITTTPDGVRWCFIRSFVDSPVPVRRVTTEFFSPGQQ